MNKVDKEFMALLKRIDEKSEEELIKEIKEKYISLPVTTQKSFEDFFKKFNYWGKLEHEKWEYEEIENKAKTIYKNRKIYEALYRELADYRSKKVLYAVLKNWLDYDFWHLSCVMEHTFSHYFDLDILKNCHEEVFVDLGAYTGDTLLEFLDTYGTSALKKAYAYELSLNTLSELRKNTSSLENIVIRNVGVSSKEGRGVIKENKESASANVLEINNLGPIEITTLDKDIKEKITILKMDIEGSEKEAIAGSKKHIQEDTPKLLLSVYHGFEDLTKIWEQIKEINPNYKFYLRYYGGAFFPTEIVLFAIPIKI